MKVRMDGLKGGDEEHAFMNCNKGRNRSQNSSRMDSQREISLQTINEIPKKICITSERIKQAYKKENRLNSITYRNKKKQSVMVNNLQALSARNTPQRKLYPHKEIFNLPSNNKDKHILQHHLDDSSTTTIPYQSRTIEYPTAAKPIKKSCSPLNKRSLNRDISEQRLQSLSSHSLDQKCCRGTTYLKQITGLRSCSQCTQPFQMNQHELEEERQKIQYILSVSGSIQNYQIYSDSEISSENRIISQYVKRFQRYVDFIVQTNALQVEQELEDIDAKLQIHREHIEFYSKQEEKYRHLSNRLQNPFHANNVIVKTEEVKKNINLIKKEINHLLSARQLNSKSAREITAIQKATILQQEVNNQGSILKENTSKLEQITLQENELINKVSNNQIISAADLYKSDSQVSLNNSACDREVAAIQENIAQQNILQHKSNNVREQRASSVTLQTDIDSLKYIQTERKRRRIRDMQAQSQISNLSQRSSFSLSQQTQQSFHHIQAQDSQDKSIHLPFNAPIPINKNIIRQKQLQKLLQQRPQQTNHTLQKMEMNRQSQSIRNSNLSIYSNHHTIDANNQNNLKYSSDKCSPYKSKEQKETHYQNFLERRNSLIGGKKAHLKRQMNIDIESPWNKKSIEKENIISKSVAEDIEVKIPQKPFLNQKYYFKNIGYKNDKQGIQRNQVQQQQNIKVEEEVEILKLKEQLNKLKNEIEEQKNVQLRQIQLEQLDIIELKNKCQVQDQKQQQLEQLLEEQDKMISQLS